MVKNLPAKAGDTGFHPWQGRSHVPQGNWAHAPQLLSLSASATEARVPGAPALPQQKPLQREARTAQPESSPRSPRLGNAWAQQWRPSTARKKERKIKKKEAENKESDRWQCKNDYPWHFWLWNWRNGATSQEISVVWCRKESDTTERLNWTGLMEGKETVSPRPPEGIDDTLALT